MLERAGQSRLLRVHRIAHANRASAKVGRHFSTSLAAAPARLLRKDATGITTLVGEADAPPRTPVAIAADRVGKFGLGMVAVDRRQHECDLAVQRSTASI